MSILKKLGFSFLFTLAVTLAWVNFIVLGIALAASVYGLKFAETPFELLGAQFVFGVSVVLVGLEIFNDFHRKIWQAPYVIVGILTFHRLAWVVVAVVFLWGVWDGVYVDQSPAIANAAVVVFVLVLLVNFLLLLGNVTSLVPRSRAQMSDLVERSGTEKFL